MSVVKAMLRAYWRPVLQGSIIVGAGVGIGLVLVPPPPPTPAPSNLSKPAEPTFTLLGKPFDIHQADATKAALNTVRAYASGRVTVTMPHGEKEVLTRAELGAEIDKVYLAAWVAQAQDPTSPLRKAFAEKPSDKPIAIPTGVFVNPSPAIAALLKHKEGIDSDPKDARLDLKARKLVPEVNGYLLDIYGTLAKIEAAFQTGADVIKAAVDVRKPRVQKASLGDVKFDEILGYFETGYAQDRKHRARTYNLRIAASKLDGYVLLPGKTFDFNLVVGPRTEAAGYKIAPVIAQGELVDGIGGGTCQVSGTLHAAAFFAGLKMVYRAPHTRPSSYIKMGLDAAVAYPSVNFKIANPFDFPVVLHEVVKNGNVRAEILGPRRTRTVAFMRKIDKVIPYKEVEKQDPHLPEGVRILSQRGVPGFKLHRYRIVRNGKHAVRERWDDTYPPTSQVIRVGTGKNLPKETHIPKDDRHPEYTADLYVQLVQGPHPKRPGESRMREKRDGGYTSKPGWTEKAGMNLWKSENRRGDDDDDKSSSKHKKKAKSKTKHGKGKSKKRGRRKR